MGKTQFEPVYVEGVLCKSLTSVRRECSAKTDKHFHEVAATLVTLRREKIDQRAKVGNRMLSFSLNAPPQVTRRTLSIKEHGGGPLLPVLVTHRLGTSMYPAPLRV